MENRKDYEKRLGERLEAAYMQEDIGPVMSREEFHMLIQTAEKKKRHRRTMFSLAAACVALCLVCGGFVAGMTMRESASAGKDDETKTVQQGGSVVIGSGVSENDQNVGVSTKTYTNIEDIPEDMRKEIHFLDSDEFELEKVKVVEVKGDTVVNVILHYRNLNGERVVIKERIKNDLQSPTMILKDSQTVKVIKGISVYERADNQNNIYLFRLDDKIIEVLLEQTDSKTKYETIICGLID